jgi:hypothetical protein
VHYGRTALEVVLAQLLIFITFLLSPFDVVEFLGPVSAATIATAYALVAAQVVFRRHRKHLADHDLGRKIRVLREAVY